MRIVLWQQFSSNHSGWFTLVGSFDTSETAELAAERLTRLFRDIADWYQKPENEASLHLFWEDFVPPTPPEIEFANELGVDWGQFGLDWLSIPGSLSGRVEIDGQSVLIQPTDLTTDGPEPIDHVLERMGAKVNIEDLYLNEPIRALLDLVCTVPDKRIGERIIRASIEYRNGNLRESPWSKHGWELFDRAQLNVRQENERLVFERTGTGSYGIKELVNYLVAQGCQNIEYAVEWH
jgi:hypothetical protein